MEPQIDNLEYSSTVSFTSQIDPRVTITLHKPSYGRRVDLDLRTANFRARVRSISRKHKKLTDELAAMERAFEAGQASSEVKAPFVIPEDAADELGELNLDSLRATAQDYNPVLVRWAVKEIQGLVINGKAAGVEELLAEGLPGMVHEIVERAEVLRGLTDAQLKNFSWPTISSDPAGGPTNDTTATSASSSSSSAGETAGEPLPAETSPNPATN